ncbi:MAG: helix-turn-helix transcriptional regulator [Firmicutes bacterium]|nr:helix-turn-helix transcriptional regulator [Bacillota bacterium]
MERRLDQIHGFMTQTFKVKLSIGASDIVQGLEMVHVGQEQAVVALNQRFLYGIGNVSVFHSETNERNSQYYYPLDKETQLVNHIKQGDKEGAHEILDHVIEENRKREISVQLSYCMMFNMLGTILKVLNDLGMEYDISQLVSQMQEAMLHQGDKTMSQLHQQIQGVIDDICDLINASKESGNVQLKTHILHYLQENYMDSNLSLVWVADQFHLSGPYLSRYFKDQMGMNFADYLCRIRINKAKELLRNPALSINDISTMVGYNSSNSFIRTFKRYESITPGQYREQMGHING